MKILHKLKRFSQHPLHHIKTPIAKAILYPFRFRRFASRKPEIAEAINEVRKRKITYLAKENLQDLAEAVEDMENNLPGGAIIEAGTALGGSAIILGLSKSQNRPLRVYDAFGMIPPPTTEDGQDVQERYETIAARESTGIDGETYYGYRSDLLGEVTQNFQSFGLEPNEHNIEMVKGLYENTMHVDYPVALAHLDCDWYKSLLTCLQQIEPHLIAGGRLVIDDYYKWSGCKKAVDEFFSTRRQHYTFVHKSRLHIIKVTKQ